MNGLSLDIDLPIGANLDEWHRFVNISNTKLRVIIFLLNHNYCFNHALIYAFSKYLNATFICLAPAPNPLDVNNFTDILDHLPFKLHLYVDYVVWSFYKCVGGQRQVTMDLHMFYFLLWFFYCHKADWCVTTPNVYKYEWTCQQHRLPMIVI